MLNQSPAAQLVEAVEDNKSRLSLKMDDLLKSKGKSGQLSASKRNRLMDEFASLAVAYVKANHGWEVNPNNWSLAIGAAVDRILIKVSNIVTPTGEVGEKQAAIIMSKLRLVALLGRKLYDLKNSTHNAGKAWFENNITHSLHVDLRVIELQDLINDANMFNVKTNADLDFLVHAVFENPILKTDLLPEFSEYNETPGLSFK